MSILIYSAGYILAVQDRDYSNVPMLVKYPDGISTARHRPAPISNDVRLT